MQQGRLPRFNIPFKPPRELGKGLIHVRKLMGKKSHKITAEYFSHMELSSLIIFGQDGECPPPSKKIKG